MDKSFVTIGESLTVKEAVNKSLPYLLDANQALFEIESDSTPRLIYLKVSRTNGASPWLCSMENGKLEDIAKIYNYNEPEYNPPRIVLHQTGIVVGPRSVTDEGLAKDPFLDASLGKIYLKGDSKNPWDAEDLPPFEFQFKMYDIETPSVPPTYPTDLWMKGEQRYRTLPISEIGTYIIPICYHRTTDKGFEQIQVLRSDASFWPMPTHQVWSMQDNWQDLWREPDRSFNPDAWAKYYDP